MQYARPLYGLNPSGKGTYRMARSTAVRLLLLSVALSLAACGASDSSLGGGTGQKKVPDAGAAGGGAGGGSADPCTQFIEICNGQDDNCNGMVDEGFDADSDGIASCNGDCDDTNAAIGPGKTEVANSIDDDCDGKVDNRISGRDYDGDGFAYGTGNDCNDEEALIGPGAIEVAGDMSDNNCNGQVDEAAPSCEAQALGNTAADMLKAIELCQAPAQSPVLYGATTAANIRPRFGAATTPWAPKGGSKMVFISSGKAVDRVSTSPLGDATYTPQDGVNNGMNVGSMRDLVELTVVLKVPQNAKSFSFDFAFFSAEFPEYVGSNYNDKFEAELISSALQSKVVNSVEQFPVAACVGGGTGCRRGNVSFDGTGKAVSVNNNYFTVCEKENSNPNTNLCKPNTLSQLNGTGYEEVKQDDQSVVRPVGGSTGWLVTKAPVKPGETIQLKFRVFDEFDSILDSAALIDNFRWETTAVTAPSTSPIN